MHRVLILLRLQYSRKLVVYHWMTSISDFRGASFQNEAPDSFNTQPHVTTHEFTCCTCVLSSLFICLQCCSLQGPSHVFYKIYKSIGWSSDWRTDQCWWLSTATNIIEIIETTAMHILIRKLLNPLNSWDRQHWEIWYSKSKYSIERIKTWRPQRAKKFVI